MKPFLQFMMGVFLGAGLAGPVAADSATTLNTQAARMDRAATSKGEAQVSGKISADFTAFAGSGENAANLVNGLRSGTEITLTTPASGGGVSSATFTPPTGTMGHGNTFISLALARQQLANDGFTQPTAEQIQTSLMGGSFTVDSGPGAGTYTYQGVLQMRSQGMGWGQIAHALNMKLGPVVSSIKSTNASLAAGSVPATGSTTTAAGSSDAKRTGGAGKSGVVSAGGGNAGSPKSPQGKSGIVTGAGTAGGGVTSPLGQGAGAAAGGKGAGGVRGKGKD